MRTLKVRLYIRVRLSSGQFAYAAPAWNRNRTLREGYAHIEGRPESHPEGIYYLRFLENGKRKWQAVGARADAAQAALQNQQHDLAGITLSRKSPNVTVPSSEAGVSEAVKSFLSEVRLFRRPKTITEYERMLRAFKNRFPDRSLSSITRQDLLNHRAALEAEGKGPRTVHNHIARVSAFLKANGITGLLKSQDKPTYDEPEVADYDADQLAALFAAANAEERLLFDFFLKTGFRDQEVMFCTWKNVDFKGKLVKVRSKPELGFRPKDHEERSVPVPDDLIGMLASRKQKSRSAYLFPSANDGPNGHFLRTLKRLALRAGLNCGECLTKKGKSCRSHATCKVWVLHSFRRTFATMHCEAGVPAPTIQRWLGHSDLATTLRYLAIADLRSDRTRQQVNSTFASITMGGALPASRLTDVGEPQVAASQADEPPCCARL